MVASFPLCEFFYYFLLGVVHGVLFRDTNKSVRPCYGFLSYPRGGGEGGSTGRYLHIRYYINGIFSDIIHMQRAKTTVL